MLKGLFGRNQDLALVGAVIAILLILFAPIPPMLLDLSIIVNFALAMTILLLTFLMFVLIDGWTLVLEGVVGSFR